MSVDAGSNFHAIGGGNAPCCLSFATPRRKRRRGGSGRGDEEEYWLLCLSKAQNIIYILGLADMTVTAEHIREKLTKDLGAVHVVHLR